MEVLRLGEDGGGVEGALLTGRSVPASEMSVDVGALLGDVDENLSKLSALLDVGGAVRTSASKRVARTFTKTSRQLGDALQLAIDAQSSKADFALTSAKIELKTEFAAQLAALRCEMQHQIDAQAEAMATLQYNLLGIEEDAKSRADQLARDAAERERLAREAAERARREAAEALEKQRLEALRALEEAKRASEAALRAAEQAGKDAANASRIHEDDDDESDRLERERSERERLERERAAALERERAALDGAERERLERERLERERLERERLERERLARERLAREASEADRAAAATAAAAAAKAEADVAEAARIAVEAGAARAACAAARAYLDALAYTYVYVGGLRAAADGGPEPSDAEAAFPGAESTELRTHPARDTAFALGKYVDRQVADRDREALAEALEELDEFPGSESALGWAKGADVRILTEDVVDATTTVVAAGDLPPASASSDAGEFEETLREMLDGYEVVGLGKRTEDWGFVVLKCASPDAALGLVSEFHGRAPAALYGNVLCPDDGAAAATKRKALSVRPLLNHVASLLTKEVRNLVTAATIPSKSIPAGSVLVRGVASNAALSVLGEVARQVAPDKVAPLDVRWAAAPEAELALVVYEDPAAAWAAAEALDGSEDASADAADGPRPILRAEKLYKKDRPVPPDHVPTEEEKAAKRARLRRKLKGYLLAQAAIRRMSGMVSLTKTRIKDAKMSLNNRLEALEVDVHRRLLRPVAKGVVRDRGPRRAVRGRDLIHRPVPGVLTLGAALVHDVLRLDGRLLLVAVAVTVVRRALAAVAVAVVVAAARLLLLGVVVVAVVVVLGALTAAVAVAVAVVRLLLLLVLVAVAVVLRARRLAVAVRVAVRVVLGAPFVRADLRLSVHLLLRPLRLLEARQRLRLGHRLPVLLQHVRRGTRERRHRSPFSCRRSCVVA